MSRANFGRARDRDTLAGARDLRRPGEQAATMPRTVNNPGGGYYETPMHSLIARLELLHFLLRLPCLMWLRVAVLRRRLTMI